MENKMVCTACKKPSLKTQTFRYDQYIWKNNEIEIKKGLHSRDIRGYNKFKTQTINLKTGQIICQNCLNEVKKNSRCRAER